MSNAAFGVSANVLIIPDLRIRRAIVRNIRRSMPKGAVMLFVVPSLESALYVN